MATLREEVIAILDGARNLSVNAIAERCTVTNHPSRVRRVLEALEKQRMAKFLDSGEWTLALDAQPEPRRGAEPDTLSIDYKIRFLSALQEQYANVAPIVADIEAIKDDLRNITGGTHD